MNTSELVQPRHLDRSAEIYVRQSSPSQVVTNKESQRMQYALRERAGSLGWHVTVHTGINYLISVGFTIV